MSEQKSFFYKYMRLIFLIAAVVGIITVIVVNIGTFGYAVMAIIGFGVVVLVHEFGHFIVAKISDIHVEAFSIGFPPVLVGILRTEEGFRIRILPGFWPRQDEDDDSDGSLARFTIGPKGKDGETEYRIGLIPFGGFVKMLGQEDTKEVDKSEDPRSYANKPVGIRMGVIAAGVMFNAVSAIIAFIVVFLIGINLTPAVVGGVKAGSPAALAGLKAGDEVIEIAGKSYNLDFMDIGTAAALSKKGEKVELKVRREDGSIKDFAIEAKATETITGKLQLFGIMMPESLTIANVSDSDVMCEETGLLPGDRITSVNGRSVERHWELMEIIENCFLPEVTLQAERKDAESGEISLFESKKLKLDLYPSAQQSDFEAEYSSVYSMIPRLRITSVSAGPASDKGRMPGWLNNLLIKFGFKDEAVERELQLQSDDIILSVGEVENPTYKELRDVTEAYEDKQMAIRVLRADANGIEQEVAVSVVPKRAGKDEPVRIGISLFPVFDGEHPVVAKTIEVEGGFAKLDIPRGAVITAVDGVGVSSFYDVIREIRKNAGRRIGIDYRVDEKTVGGVMLEVDSDSDFILSKTGLETYIPVDGLERLYRASGPVDAVVMGCSKTVTFIGQAYMTLQRFLTGRVSPKNFMGPIGILTISYQIVKNHPTIKYVYFLSLISAFIAVFNSLPVLPFDGGHIVFLLIEKIKGSAVSERVQVSVLYAGLVIVLGFALYVTFNDVVRIFVFR
jgi:regulator of sigma E protease